MKQKIKTVYSELGLFTSFFISNENGLFPNIYSL